MLHVTVIHHRQLLRRGLESALERSGDIKLTICDSARVGLAAVREHPRTVVLAAQELPSLNGLLATLGAEGCRRIPVALIGDLSDSVGRPALLPPGIVGLLPEDATPRALAHAVHVLGSGAAVVPATLIHDPAGHHTNSAAIAGALTVREREVLTLIGDGLTNQQISSRLQLTLSTVKAYVSDVYVKCGVSNRVHAALLSHGIVGRDRPGQERVRDCPGRKEVSGDWADF
ncbi:response regulator transcription factor [Streptomyces sp. NPDC093109]|uniref:response regulator transcription factor n=1 Tax=Streptomyces sp. NPDC093109 TaxID=3154977 RepID=UPI00344E50FB